MSLSSEPLFSARVLRETTRPYFTSFPSHLQVTQHATWDLVQERFRVHLLTTHLQLVRDCVSSGKGGNIMDIGSKCVTPIVQPNVGAGDNIGVATRAFFCTRVAKRDLSRCCLNESAVGGNPLKSLDFPPLMNRCARNAARDANVCPPHNVITTFLASVMSSFVTSELLSSPYEANDLQPNW